MKRMVFFLTMLTVADLIPGVSQLLVSDVEAVVICAKKSNPNKVKLRANCKGSETVVTLGAESVPPPSPGETLEVVKAVDGVGSGIDADTLQSLTPEEIVPTPEETLAAVKAVDGAGSGLDADTLRGFTPQQLMSGGPGSAGLVVRDATGALVGSVIDLRDDDRVSVARRIGSQVGFFLMETESVLPDVEFWYESSDCSGTRLLEVSDPGEEFRPTLVRFSHFTGGTAYYPTGEAREVNAGSQSQFDTEEGCRCAGGLTCVFLPPDQCCFLTPRGVRVAVAASVELGFFVPPFRFDL